MLRRNTNLVILAAALDLGCLPVAILLALWARLRLPFGIALTYEPGLKVFIGEALILYPLIFFLLSLYDPDQAFQPADELQRLSVACLVAALALAGLIFFTARENSRLFMLYFYAIHFLLAHGWRLAAVCRREAGKKNGAPARRVLLIGSGEAARRAYEKLEELAWAGLQPAGYLAEEPGLADDPERLPYLGHIARALAVVEAHHVDDVLIALPPSDYAMAQELSAALLDQPCSVWLVPDYFNLLVYGSPAADLGGLPVIGIKSPALSGYQRVLKRLVDLALGGLTLLAALPLLALAALAVRLTSPGPALIRQRRVGENGRIFWMVKFRTMFAGAQNNWEENVLLDAQGQPVYKRPDDPRITPLGGILRRLSLDELPQLWNVLRGEMSLVGPRPELPALVAQYQPWQQKRLAVPQGMTGWWQVNGRSDKPMHLNTEFDLYYVANYSLGLDLQILWKTIWVVLRGQGSF